MTIRVPQCTWQLYHQGLSVLYLALMDPLLPLCLSVAKIPKFEPELSMLSGKVCDEFILYFNVTIIDYSLEIYCGDNWYNYSIIPDYVFVFKYVLFSAHRHWQELGYLIIYVTGRPDMQKQKVVSWLAQHNFPLGLVSFADGLSRDPLGHKADYLRSLMQVCNFGNLQSRTL